MSFFVNQLPSLSDEDWTSAHKIPFEAYLAWQKKQSEAYRAYLDAIKHRLPASAYEFAVAEWHYNPQDPRCPHDAWLQELKVREISSGERQEIRHTQIEIVLLGAHHDRLIKLTYLNVGAYNLASPEMQHGDWSTDEIRIAESGQVVHEIEFKTDSRWYIECRDIRFEEQVIESAASAVWKD